jgi:hypothetical protein
MSTSIVRGETTMLADKSATIQRPITLTITLQGTVHNSQESTRLITFIVTQTTSSTPH